MFLLDEFADLVQELWRQTPWAPADFTWRRVSSLDCSNTLTNTAAWPPTVFGDGTRRLARRHVALQSLQVQRRPRAATTHSFIDQQRFNRAHTLTRKKIQTIARLIQMCTENAVTCGVFGQCRCQSAWMDGATSCSWVFVCECARVRFYTKIPTIWTMSDKYTNAFFTKETFYAPNSSERQLRKTNFVVGNDEKVARRINAAPDVTTRPPVYGDSSG